MTIWANRLVRPRKQGRKLDNNFTSRGLRRPVVRGGALLRSMLKHRASAASFVYADAGKVAGGPRTDCLELRYAGPETKTVPPGGRKNIELFVSRYGSDQTNVEARQAWLASFFLFGQGPQGEKLKKPYPARSRGE